MSTPFGRPPRRPFDPDEDPVITPGREVRVGEKIIPDERASEDVRAQAEEPNDAVEEPPDPLAVADEAGTDEHEPEPEPEPELRGPASTVPAELHGDAIALETVAAEPEDGVAVDEPAAVEHAPGDLRIPEGVGVFVGSVNGTRRSVGIAVSSFNGDITTRLLEGALEALAEAGVDRARVDVMRVPGAFELPLAAMALAKTRRYACVLALGCIIRGDTPHFEYIAAEAASGLQLAALETGVPVSFGVLTCDSRMQAEARAGGRQGNKGAEAAQSGLEMADVFARLRSDAVAADRR